jgi:hypothetical protein
VHRGNLPLKPPITPISLLKESKKPYLSLKLDRQAADHKGNAADHSWTKPVIGRSRTVIGKPPITKEAYLSLISSPAEVMIGLIGGLKIGDLQIRLLTMIVLYERRTPIGSSSSSSRQTRSGF